MKIYFLVATQPDNLGDLLINKMLIDELSKYGEVYVDAEGLPNKFKSYLLENEQTRNFVSVYGGSLKRSSMFSLLPIVRREFDFYFKSPGPFGGEGYVINSLIKRIVMTYQFRYFAKGGLSVNAIGNDILLNNKLNIFFERINNKYFSNTFVRSISNLKELESQGIENVDFIPDVGFLYNKYKNVKYKNKVFISFRNLNDSNYLKKILDYLTIVIPFFISQGLKIVFFYQVGSDRVFNITLYNKYKELYDCKLIEKCMWYDEISDAYNKSSYVITNRLHVMILGIVHRAVPLLVLNSDAKTSKINRILLDNNIEEFIQDANSDIKEFHKNYNQNQIKIDDLVKVNYNKCEQKIASIFE